MSQTVAIYRVYELPWSTNADQERKFRRIATVSFAALTVLSIGFALLPLPERDPAAVDEIADRYVRLLIDRPPPPPVVREQPPEPEPLPEEPPVVEEPVAAEPVVVPPRVEPKPVPVVEPPVETPPVNVTEQARARASVAGLLPLAAELSSLRNNEAVGLLDRADIVAGEPGTAEVTERSLITSRVGSGSGGINTAALSRNTGGGGLGGRATTQVASPVVAATAQASGSAVERSGDSAKPSRSREEIERVFDLNKGAIYNIYNRALRQNPALQGKVVLRLTIAPDGRVTSCEVVSSELDDPELEQKLVQRVLLFQFDAKNVEPITTTKPIDFFPA